MLNCFTSNSDSLIPITLITPTHFTDWQAKQNKTLQQWLVATQFTGEVGTLRFIPDDKGAVERIIFSINSEDNFLALGQLPLTLTNGNYRLEVDDEEKYANYALGWGLGAYQFTKYKKATKSPGKLFLPEKIAEKVKNVLQAIYVIRDLINIPADDMGPSQLADYAEKIAKEYKASFKQIAGEALLKENYPAIYTVGRASDDAPRLIDIRWGDESHPKVTLVGKGVCFDSGGLDIKSAPYMLLMKKDMAGGAHVLGLAKMIMQANLPIRLRVLIPAVENVIAGNAYRPGDVINTRKGMTVEIGNTDAEGRLVLADALTEAVSEKPELIVDISTLTGAARVAVGTELSALFSNNDDLANTLLKAGEKVLDPLWRLPLYAPYREYLNSSIADINNNSTEPYGGAITAALFLKEFVPDDIPWVHFDIMAYNLRTKPGKPQGGEAMAVRVIFEYLLGKFK